MLYEVIRTGNISVQKWLIVNANVNMFHYRITGDLNGESIDRESTNWGGRLNTTRITSYNVCYTKLLRIFPYELILQKQST